MWDLESFLLHTQAWHSMWNVTYLCHWPCVSIPFLLSFRSRLFNKILFFYWFVVVVVVHFVSECLPTLNGFDFIITSTFTFLAPPLICTPGLAVELAFATLALSLYSIAVSVDDVESKRHRSWLAPNGVDVDVACSLRFFFTSLSFSNVM